MKLSEAIRLGAMLRPQMYGWYFGNDGSCAIGAALEASGQAYVIPFADISLGCRATELFPVLVNPWQRCPECGTAGPLPRATLLQEIAHLNDAHHWTRERIADWVEQIERERESSAAPDAAPALAENTK